MGISTNPETFTEGMFDDMSATVKDSKFVLYDYDKGFTPSPCLMLDLAPDEAEAGKTYKQYWSCGKATDFSPSQDGKELLPVGTKTALANSCNLALLCRSMLEAGVPKELVNEIGSNAPALVGAKFHFIRQPIVRKNKDKSEVNQSVLVVANVIALPGEGQDAESKKGKGKGKAKAAEPLDEQKVVDVVMEVLAENGGTVAQDKLPAMVWAKTQNKEIMALAFKDEFLAAEGRPWTFKDKQVSL